MNTSHTVCQIEHHAMMFAFLSKHAIRLCGNRGKDAILDAMTKYGKERGRRMALNAQTHGDPLNTMTNQAYGEWKPGTDGIWPALYGADTADLHFQMCLV